MSTTFPDRIHDLRRETAEAAAESYEASSCYVVDALEWVAEAGELPDDLVALACEHYRESARYRSVLDDALDGEVAW